MMKADVLSGMGEIKAGVGYEIDGKKTNTIPFNMEDNKLKPVFQSFKGWDEDLCPMTKESQLPQTFRDYISFLERTFSIPISILSVGPGREQTIRR
jgi:adenylosuccinate synthase